jgi:hypothetical protein
MGKSLSQTVAAAAAGNAGDVQYWRSLREKAVTNWEGERRTPAEESSMLKDGTGLFA